MTRPKISKAQKKCHVVSTKLSEREYQIFINKCSRAKMSTSNMIRESINKCHISSSRMTEILSAIERISTSEIIRVLLIQSKVIARFSEDEIKLMQNIYNEMQQVNTIYIKGRQDGIDDPKFFDAYINALYMRINKLLR